MLAWSLLELRVDARLKGGAVLDHVVATDEVSSTVLLQECW